jgi:hypothetical protein
MHKIETGRSGCASAQRRRKGAGGALLIQMAGLTALKEVEQALVTYSGESLSASQAAAVAALTLSQLRYRRGSPSFDFITLKRTAVETEAELAASNSALANDQAAVFKSPLRGMGGGPRDREPAFRVTRAS